ncbi:MAG: proton-conducting transporter membrane subunit, partial [Candidatus Omnitrophica bacterium]|nr:proton-conducting transporter membrane subunit [Candidatus Omnitrophota bacterium]
SAPAPISAMLSGVVIKILGVYGLSRIVFNIIGFNPKISTVFVSLGIVSMVVGVLLAIGQWDFKRLLAYHSISQIGYVVFGLGLGTPLGILGGLFHLFNHSIFKSLLFLNAGAVEYKTGTRNLKELKNLKVYMPYTWVSCLVASFSIAGVPPFCGFWSKLMIIMAAIQLKNFWGAIICILVSLLTLASFLKVQNYVFLRKADENKEMKEVGLSLLFPMLILALVCVLVGLFFLPTLKNLIEPAEKILSLGKKYINLVIK